MEVKKRKSKINGEIEEKIKELLTNKETPNFIGKAIGISRDTVKSYLKKNNLPVYGRNAKKEEAYNNFVKNFKDTKNITQSRRKFNISYKKALQILEEHGLKKLDRSESSVLLRTLNVKEAQLRLPNQKDKILGFEDGRYKIITEDGYIYYKKSSKLYQGDPRGKSGATVSIQSIIERLDSIGYTVIESTYTSIRKPLEALCRKCNTIRRNRFHLFFNQRCATCNNDGVSKAEGDVKNFIKELGIETEKYRFSGKTKGKEIDIFIPSLNVGIEYCGLYWHTENSPQPRTRSYHYDKMKQCNDQGIRLITIFSDEWENRSDQIKNYLKSVVGSVSNRVFARKCVVKVIEKDIAKLFIERNHIQGKSFIKIALGLYYKDKLVGVVTGNSHHRQGYSEVLVLNRLCFEDGYQVVGGASKLLKSLKKYAEDSNYKQIISWSDNRWSEGTVYEKCGFVLESNLPPDYSYVDKHKRIPKQSCKKRLLLTKGAVGTMDNTEKELAKTLGFSRIWDCGKKKWTLTL